jgi:hypothetical protein
MEIGYLISTLVMLSVLREVPGDVFVLSRVSQQKTVEVKSPHAKELTAVVEAEGVAEGVAEQVRQPNRKIHVPIATRPQHLNQLQPANLLLLIHVAWVRVFIVGMELIGRWRIRVIVPILVVVIHQLRMVGTPVVKSV